MHLTLRNPPTGPRKAQAATSARNPLQPSCALKQQVQAHAATAATSSNNISRPAHEACVLVFQAADHLGELRFPLLHGHAVVHQHGWLLLEWRRQPAACLGPGCGPAGAHELLLLHCYYLVDCQGCLVHSELDGISGSPCAQVVHACMVVAGHDEATVSTAHGLLGNVQSASMQHAG